jgi:Trp operon repressor
MGRERLSMRQTKEILRQKLLLHRSHREVAQSLRVGIGTITSTLARGYDHVNTGPCRAGWRAGLGRRGASL